LNAFSKLIEKENLDDISLTIYYLRLSALTPLYLSADDLVYGMLDGSTGKRTGEGVYDHKVVVSADELEEHIDLLKQINNRRVLKLAN